MNDHLNNKIEKLEIIVKEIKEIYNIFEKRFLNKEINC